MEHRNCIIALLILAVSGASSVAGEETGSPTTQPRQRPEPARSHVAAEDLPQSPGYTLACYYFPNYHVDPRNEAVHGVGWTEWELVKKAQPRFPGHRQPKVPAWGYEDEADPAVMARKIAVAADHGIDAFIFDWYYYDTGPFLERCLNEGFLKASNVGRLKFALMWANHDWKNLHPAKQPGKESPLLYPGKVTPETFDRITDHIVQDYFRHPSYWTIAGRPYFSIYDIPSLIESFGGLDATARALGRFREKTKAAGFADLHLNLITWSIRLLPGEKTVKNPAELADRLGCDSVTSYVWIHHARMDQFPETPYDEIAKKSIAYWQKAVDEFHVPYFPNVTMGWDPSPRTDPSGPFANKGYPYTPSLSGNTPAAFKDAMVQAKHFVDRPGNSIKIVTFNAWNEWTESSYLEPDTTNGMAYLEAIKAVWGR